MALVTFVLRFIVAFPISSICTISSITIVARACSIRITTSSLAIKVDHSSTSFVINSAVFLGAIRIHNGYAFVVILFSQLSFIDSITDSFLHLMALLNREHSRNFLILNILFKGAKQFIDIEAFPFL